MNLSQTVLEANVSSDPLETRVESTGWLTIIVETLVQGGDVRDDQRRLLELLKDNILDLQSFLINAISRTHRENLNYESMRKRCELIQIIINEDIKYEAFKHKLKAMIDYMQKKLFQPDLPKPKREPLELKRLMLDLIAYGNSEDRTDAEKVEFDLYMSVLGPNDRSI